VRLLYGGRNSLEIGAVATLITMVLATILGSWPATSAAGSTGDQPRHGRDLGLPGVLLGITLGTIIAFGGIGPLKGTTLMCRRS
jgi:peptide/nickel transport system permease protein